MEKMSRNMERGLEGAGPENEMFQRQIYDL